MMGLKIIFGIFSVLGTIFVIMSGTFKLLNLDSNHSNSSEPSIVSSTLIKALTILGIHLLVETYIFNVICKESQTSISRGGIAFL